MTDFYIHYLVMSLTLLCYAPVQCTHNRFIYIYFMSIYNRVIILILEVTRPHIYGFNNELFHLLFIKYNNIWHLSQKTPAFTL